MGEATAETEINPAAPDLAGSFHTAYYISAWRPTIPFMPGVSRWLSHIAELLEGECWQNTDQSSGAVTIKTVTTPTTVGSLIIPSTTSVWVVDHGWTYDAKKKTCSADDSNSQLVIPGNVLKESGVFKGNQKIQPMVRVSSPKPNNKDGSYNVDVWDATLPNGEGTVTYYLLSGMSSPTPILSHYALKDKPPVWAQYKFFVPGLNAASNYLPTAACLAASRPKTPAAATAATATRAPAHP